MDASDEELMLGYQAGDAAAFDALFERYRRPLYGYILRLIQVRACAEDLFQDTWLFLHRYRRQYTKKSKFSSWLFRIATHRCYNLLARAERQHVHQSLQAPVNGTDGALLEIHIGGMEPDAGLRAEMNDQQRLIEEALAELPVDYRAAFVLHYVNGLTYAEMAEISEVTETTCRTRAYRACKELRKMLAGKIDLGRVTK
ncbi:MAG: sigma-70 family RNA polymerase sigma factor [Kiritimatiellae bacterium]|nr:sigma-70 family RNA polymerase sigma factor [Kiritimatiellia bacterium]